VARTLLAEVVTPDGILYANEVEMVVVTTISGELGILPMHAPLITTLVAGEARVKHGPNPGDWEWFAISGGFLQVREDRVVIISKRAIAVSAIDAERAQGLSEQLRGEIEELPAEAAEERAAAEIDRSWYELQLKQAERRRGRN
jgi:F-type H+-transporting ATPase subunit epsilon